ncbi:MAG: hypothetical protein Kow00105_09830 [Phycisphaeraceae bacterium]
MKDVIENQDEHFCFKTNSLRTLSLADVRKIHRRLVADFANTKDPIEPPGERAGGMLQSAVARQWAGTNGLLLYPQPVQNAAALCYGLCKNHPFANGNKRTALVATLVHLDRNDYMIKQGVSHKDVYDFIVSLADSDLHRMVSPTVITDLRGKDPRSYEVQLACCIKWLTINSRRIQRGERQVNMRELKKILSKFGYELRDPYKNYADIIKIEEVVEWKWLSMIKKTRRVEKKVSQIACSGMNQTVEINTIKRVRKQCGLRDVDGVDSEVFYGGLDRADFFLNQYRNILRRLGRT